MYQILPDPSSLPGKSRFIGSDWGVTPPMYRPAGQAPADVTPHPHPVSRLVSHFLGIHGSTHRPAHLIYQILAAFQVNPGLLEVTGG